MLRQGAWYSNPISDPAVNLSVTPGLALNLSAAHVTLGGAIRFFNILTAGPED